MQETPQTLEAGYSHKLTAAPITTTQLVKYAGASGDFNRIHFDKPYAEENGLPGVIAHGMLTMAIAGRCLSEIAGESWHIAEFSARFLAPVLVGDIVEITATVAEGGTAIRLEITGNVGARLVLNGNAQLVPRHKKLAS